MAQLPTLREIEAYIREAAGLRGIDPDVAVRVAKSEGLQHGTWQSGYTKNGVREPSYGPYQLLVGGAGTGFPKGLGNAFKRATGLDPRDKNSLWAGIDFALNAAAKNGWGAWYGAAKVGVDNWTGLRGAQPAPINQQAVQIAQAPLPADAPIPEPASLVARVDEAPIPGNLPSVTRPDNFAAAGPSFPKQVMTATSAPLQAPAAERFGRGSGVTEAPIQAGFMPSFSDLARYAKAPVQEPIAERFGPLAPTRTDSPAELVKAIDIATMAAGGVDPARFGSSAATPQAAPIAERFGPLAPATTDSPVDLVNAVSKARMAPSDAIDPARFGATATAPLTAPSVDTRPEARTDPNNLVNAVSRAAMATPDGLGSGKDDIAKTSTADAMLAGMDAPVYRAGQTAPVTLDGTAPAPVQAGFAPPAAAPIPEPAPAAPLAVPAPAAPQMASPRSMEVGPGAVSLDYVPPELLPTPLGAPAATPVAPQPPLAAAPAPKFTAPPTVVKQRPIAVPQTAPAPRVQAPPAATPYDVYNGLASSAMSASGNQVTRDAFGNTAVTNKYGVTTMMTPQGQAATSSPLAGLTSSKATIAGPLAGDTKITAPEQKTGGLGSTFKTGAGALMGVKAGSMFGPVGMAAGAAIGGLLARELAKPNGGRIGGLLGNRTTASKDVQQQRTEQAHGDGGWVTEQRQPTKSEYKALGVNYKDSNGGWSEKALSDIASGKAGLY